MAVAEPDGARQAGRTGGNPTPAVSEDWPSFAGGDCPPRAGRVEIVADDGADPDAPVPYWPTGKEG